MHIQNKNASCACGSGNKFKHCCGHKSLVNKQSERLDKELSELHREMIRAASTDFQGELIAYIKRMHPEVLQQDSASIYQTGLFFWFVAYYVLPRHKQTIADMILRIATSKYSSEALRFYRHWVTIKPSVFHVTAVKEHTVTLTELTQDVTTTITPVSTNDYIEDSIVIGTLAPFGRSRQFLLVMVKLFNNNQEEVLKYLESIPYKRDMNKFPVFLKKVLEAEYLHVEWKEQDYEHVIKDFIDYMVETDKPDQQISEGIKYWHQFCEEKSPQIKNKQNYVAALSYLICSEYESVTQAELAKYFNINPSTLSQTLKRIKQ